MTAESSRTGSALAAQPYAGRMPARVGDMAVETHGIAPIPPGNRYGTARAPIEAVEAHIRAHHRQRRA